MITPLSAATPADTAEHALKQFGFVPPYWPVFIPMAACMSPGHAEKESDCAFGQVSLNLRSSVPESSSPGLRK